MLIKTNIVSVTESLKKRMLSLQDKNTVVRTVATTMAAEVRDRIHEKGLNSDGQPIGTYSDEYMKVRKKKGKGSSTRVVISFDRALQNDFSLTIKDPIKTPLGWGLGFRNTGGVDNASKAEWMEERFGSIWALTSAELKQVKEVAEFETRKILNKK